MQLAEPALCLHHVHIAIAGGNLGAIWGVVAAVMGPSIAIATWFGLTWTYRTEKRIVLNEVIRRLRVSDLGKAHPALQSEGLLAGNPASSWQDEELSPETRKIATDITQRCLRRWDGWLGIRASSDSGGNRAGIWRDRYDTVRCAVLLLAFRKLNQALQDNPSSFRADCPRRLTAIEAL